MSVIEWPDSPHPYLRKLESLPLSFGSITTEGWQFFFLVFSWRHLGTLPWHSVYQIHDRGRSNKKDEVRGTVSEEVFHIIETWGRVLYVIYIFFFLFRNRNLSDCDKCHLSQKVWQISTASEWITTCWRPNIRKNTLRTWKTGSSLPTPVMQC